MPRLKRVESRSHLNLSQKGIVGKGRNSKQLRILHYWVGEKNTRTIHHNHEGGQVTPGGSQKQFENL